MSNPNFHGKPPKTSWERVGKWYNKAVGRTGSYFHEHIVIPGVLKLLNLAPNSRLIDLACGQGILGRFIPKTAEYTGLDISPTLINDARKLDPKKNHQYLVADVTKSLPLIKQDFTHAAIILSLQNIEHPELVLITANKHLESGGKLVIVINHPCFRIPRQSGWGIDQQSKIQYRYVNRYLSALKIPITMHPGRPDKSPVTWTFHYPLSTYSQVLEKCGFVIEKIEEWTSDKKSVGPAGRMENRSRSEIPLFMAIAARKK